MMMRRGARGRVCVCVWAGVEGRAGDVAVQAGWLAGWLAGGRAGGRAGRAGASRYAVEGRGEGRVAGLARLDDEAEVLEHHLRPRVCEWV